MEEKRVGGVAAVTPPTKAGAGESHSVHGGGRHFYLSNAFNNLRLVVDHQPSSFAPSGLKRVSLNNINIKTNCKASTPFFPRIEHGGCIITSLTSHRMRSSSPSGKWLRPFLRAVWTGNSASVPSLRTSSSSPSRLSSGHDRCSPQHSLSDHRSGQLRRVFVYYQSKYSCHVLVWYFVRLPWNINRSNDSSYLAIHFQY